MKRKHMAVIGMVLCFMMLATMAWALPGVPNGTITDGNLVWLKNANCFGRQSWYDAMNSAASLKSGSCGLTDGSTVGQWRLPTKDELVNRQRNQQGFYNVQSPGYWSSSNCAGAHHTYGSWLVYMGAGYTDVAGFGFKADLNYVWPVRGGQ